jgi:predicted nucleic acid-binding protein
MTGVDTSFLCALYRTQDNSDRAITYRSSMEEPLTVTPLLLWEFRQAARFQAFRFRNNPKLGYPLHEAEKMISDLKEDLDNGSVVVAELDWMNTLIFAERLSKTRTHTGGHRSFDILHIAAALQLEADAFLSFDGNQNTLAAAEGLATPLALHSPET